MFEDVPKEEDIEYQFIKKDYYQLLKDINNDNKVYNEKCKIAKIADKMAHDLCKMDYYTVGLCGWFAGVKGLLTNPDFIYACVSQDCKKAREDFKQKLYQEMFNNGNIVTSASQQTIDNEKKELLQDISMLNSFYALCVNTVQMMYKYYTNGNFQLDDDKLKKSYNQLCSNKQSMMDAIHKNIRAIVYLAKGGKLLINTHPNEISKWASYFLNNVLPKGQKFLSISQTPEGHKTNAADRQLDLNMIGAYAYVSIEMFNCLAKDALKIDGLNGLMSLFAHQEIPFIQNWLQKRKETVKKNLNLQCDVANYTSQQLLQTVQQKAMLTAQQQSEQLICQPALNQIALCLRKNFNIFPFDAQSPCGQTYRATLGFPQQLQSFCQCPTLQNYIHLLFATNGTPIYYNQDMDAIEIMQTFANIKNLNAQFVQIINTTYGQNINENFSNYLIANFLSAPFEQQCRNTLCQQLDVARKAHDKYINNILNWSKNQQSKIQMKTQYILNNYPGLKAIVYSGGHYYNTYHDTYECGNNYIPMRNYNSLKDWRPAQNDKQLSFDIITATPKDIDRQTNNQQLPNLKDFVCHDQKDKTGETDCVLNLMGFNDDDICEKHCGIQNIHTLSSTYNHSNGDSSKPPKIMDTIFDSMLHDTKDYRPEQQIQTAGDIWLNDLDKPLWAKTLQSQPTTTLALRAGINKDPNDGIKKCLDSLIKAWFECVSNNNDLARTRTLHNTYCYCHNTLSQYTLSGTNTTITKYMETLSETHFNIKPCWKWLPTLQDFLLEDNTILQHIKTVIIPIFCLITGEEKYDVFFGCYNDWSTFKKLIEQKFNKQLYQHEQQNNQLQPPQHTNNVPIPNINNVAPPNINNNNNEINNINNNIIIQNDIYNHKSRNNVSRAINQDDDNTEQQSSNTFQCHECIPQCCTNWCAQICSNNYTSPVNQY